MKTTQKIKIMNNLKIHENLTEKNMYMVTDNQNLLGEWKYLKHSNEEIYMKTYVS